MAGNGQPRETNCIWNPFFDCQSARHPASDDVQDASNQFTSEQTNMEPIWNPFLDYGSPTKPSSDDVRDASDPSIAELTNTSATSNQLHPQPVMKSTNMTNGNLVYPVPIRPYSTMFSSEYILSRPCVGAYKCDECNIVFLRHSDLESHLQCCGGHEPFESDTHQQNTRQGIWEPILSHRSATTAPVSDDVRDASDQSILEPTNTSISDPLYPQPTINLTSTTSGSLVYPVAMRPSWTTFSCEYNQSGPYVGPFKWAECNAVFLHKSDLDYHLQFCGGHGPVQSDTHQCNTTSEADAGIGLQVNLGQRRLQCDACSESFSMEGNLQQHKCQTISKEKFSDPPLSQEDLQIHTTRKLYKCDICKDEFRRKDHLRVHLHRMHTDKKPFPCHKGSKKFSLKSDLETHLVTLEVGNWFHCTVCARKFRGRGYLNRHMRTHTGEKPYQCPECEGKFCQRSNLKQHMRIHTGEKPYQCPECDGKFSRPGSLNRHMRKHTGEKPFQCPECARKFSQMSSLKMHVRIHTEEKPLNCSQCGGKFRCRAHSKQRMRTHTGEL